MLVPHRTADQLVRSGSSQLITTDGAEHCKQYAAIHGRWRHWDIYRRKDRSYAFDVVTYR
jgi:hypothetical protein